MPSIAAYTPLESLLFFQSVARYGADADSLAEISQSLSSNQFVRDDEKYSPTRLEPEALRSLYTSLIHTERDNKSGERSNLNGRATTNGSNPRKRKLSSPSPPTVNGSQDDEMLITALVDKLYAEYRELVIKGIREDEEQYGRLQGKIAELEHEEGTQQPARLDDTTHNAQHAHQSEEPAAVRPLSAEHEGQGAPEPRPHSVQAQAMTKGESYSGRPTSETNTPDLSKPITDIQNIGARDSNRASMTPAHQSPALGHREIGAHHSPSPIIANGQRGPPLPLPQSSQGMGRSPAPSPLSRTLPPPSPFPHHQGYGPISAQHPFSGIASPGSPVILPPPPGMTPLAHQRTPSDGSRAPVPMPHPQQYQQYPPYNFSQSAWPHQPHPNQQYPQHQSPYSNPTYYPPPAPGANMYPSQTPTQAQYAYYPQSAPVNRPMLQPATPAMAYHQQVQSASATSTPVNVRLGKKDRMRPAGSSTPWTPKAGPASGHRPVTPVRPDRDVSPLSPPGSPIAIQTDEPEKSQPLKGKPKKLVQKAPTSTSAAQVKSESLQAAPTGRSNRRKRAGSTTSSAMASESRSQSLASFASENRIERASTVRKVKNEPPSTPAPLQSDNEQHRSSGLRRGRGNTASSQLESTRSTLKRKRDTGREPSPSPSLPTPYTSRLRPRPESTDPSLVAVTKNFARLTVPIMNDVNTHRHASLFAKPLTEREAPGYKNLIYRPQDLKSIKTAIGKGSRAANAAIEDLNAAEDVPGTPGKNSNTGTGGTILLKKTDDLVPPKGIVNPSQLEMELIRLASNAIMFNPLPANERGFGPRFKMQRVDGKDAIDGNQPQEGDGEGAKGYSYVQTEEGGIIADTRAMFEDVERSVADWRSADQGFASLDAVSRSNPGLGLGLRGGSMSMSDVAGEESASEEEENRPSTARKRRRVDGNA